MKGMGVSLCLLALFLGGCTSKRAVEREVPTDKIRQRAMESVLKQQRAAEREAERKVERIIRKNRTKWNRTLKDTKRLLELEIKKPPKP